MNVFGIVKKRVYLIILKSIFSHAPNWLPKLDYYLNGQSGKKT